MTIDNNVDAARFKTLQALNVLDSHSESAFEGLTKAAASICGVPVAVITLIDKDRLLFKAKHGLLRPNQIDRASSFCEYTIQQHDVLEISNLQEDPRFAKNSLLKEYPELNYYAGIPLQLKDGAIIGTLCILGTESKSLTPHQHEILKHLANTAVQLHDGRQITSKLREREAELSTLTDSSPLGICCFDLIGSCHYVNKNWQMICDMSEAEALGFGWAKVIHPDDKKEILTHWTTCIATFEKIDSEFRILQKDGSVRHARIVTNAVKSESGKAIGFVGSLEDITSIKQQKESIRKSNSLLKQISSLANVGGWELDIPTNTLLWSEQTYRIHGLTSDYIPNVKTAINFYAPEARPVIEDAFNRALKEGRDWDLELPFMRSDGTSIWVRAVGTVETVNDIPVRLVGALQNITDKVMQRQAIEYAHKQITTATENGNIGVWDWNPTSNSLEWTPKMFALYGCTGDTTNVSYDRWISCMHPDDRFDAERTLKNALSDSSNTDFDDEYRVIWPDGSIHTIKSTAQITRDSNGTAIRLLGVNWDVTPLYDLRSEVTEKHELLQVTLQSIGDAVITSDTEGNTAWLNPAAEQLTGWHSSEAIGLPISNIFNVICESDRRPANNPVAICLTKEERITTETPNILVAKDGREFGIEESASPIFNNTGDLLGAILVFRDVTDQRRRDAVMQYRATHDSLTGLVNRIEFESRVQLALDDSHKNNAKHALMFIDLDQFKLVNDACGHAEGDLLLQQIAKLLSNNVSRDDVIGRLGGDEFAILLENCDTAEAQKVAQRICGCMDDYSFVHEERRFRIGTSIGLVPLDNRWNNIESATQAADSACYAAKDAGRNRVHLWFDTDKSAQLRQEDTQWADKLATALDEDGFVLHAQKIKPVNEMETGIVAEVLIRLDDEDGSLIPPNSFLPAAERFSIATRIDAWVLTRICELLRDTSTLSRIKLLFVNLSAQSVSDFAFQDKILKELDELPQGSRNKLCIDITETALVSNFTDVSTFIRKIRELNVRVALDHFGANAPTYNYLNNLDIDFIKIDGDFIQGMTTNPLDAAAVRSILDIGQILKVKTLAAHVENQATLQLVKEMKVDLAQGFFVHEPQELEAVLRIKQTIG